MGKKCTACGARAKAWVVFATVLDPTDHRPNGAYKTTVIPTCTAHIEVLSNKVVRLGHFTTVLTECRFAKYVEGAS